MNLQVRIRTDASYEQLEYVSAWLTEASRGYAFEHKVPDNHHYHIYLFGINRNIDAMRRHLGKHLPSKECYAISTTCGKKKNPVEPRGAYIYGTTSSLLQPCWRKGFSDEEMMEHHDAAKVFYKTPQVSPSASSERVEKKVPYQQSVICYASAEWYKYKREQRDKGEEVEKKEIIKFVCSGMREHGRGVNPHLVRDLVYAVLYDDVEYTDRVLKAVAYNINL